MRVLGKYADSQQTWYRIPQGGYVALDVQLAGIDTYNGKSTEECHECYIRLYGGDFLFRVKTKDGNYFSPEIANNFIKDLATNDIINLDLYNMALFEACDRLPEDINVRNEIDDDLNTIPLEVVIVNN